MEGNFNQAAMLVENNKVEEAKVSGGAKIALYLVLTLPAFLGWVWYVQKRNWFQAKKEDVVEKLSNIDAKLEERFATLTKQMDIAKGLLKHEKTLFEDVAKMRAGMGNTPGSIPPSQIADKNAAVAGLTSKFNMVMERYPDIKTMPAMEKIIDKVSDLESDLEAQRRFYSRVARKFNTAIKVFPTNVVAENMELKRYPMFETSSERRKDVEVKL